jgi:hypothetical protein
MPSALGAPGPLCANAIKAGEEHDFSLDAAFALIDEYARHVENLLDPRAGECRIEYSYGRLLGTRGNICRICPPAEMDRLDRRSRQRWEWAETRLRGYLGKAGTLPEVIAIAQRVESGWADSMGRYIDCLSSRLAEYGIPDQLGILKGIDTVGMHLAQREIFELTHTLAIPLENANAVKLHVRLLALFLALHRCHFELALPAIRSYRDTFRINDPVAYPWWFVDHRLTERQLNWTYRRIPIETLDWRF